MPAREPDFYRENPNYEVTVLLMTYNLKDFIREALDSIIMQKVNFKYQLLVADDCSTDGTFEIIQEYAKKHDFIHINRSEKNSGSLEHAFLVRDSIDTRYIAYLDGDDYWLDENKLQEQFDLMENNKDCAVVYDSFYRHDFEHPCTFRDKISNYTSVAQTGVTFYRNIIDFSLYPKQFQDDGGAWLVFSLYGKLAYRSKITSFYRYNPNGLWISLTEEQKDNLEIALNIILLGFCLKENLNNNFIHEKLYDNFSLMYKYIKHINKGTMDSKLENCPKYLQNDESVSIYTELNPIEKYWAYLQNDESVSIYIDEFKNRIEGIFCSKLEEHDKQNTTMYYTKFK